MPIYWRHNDFTGETRSHHWMFWIVLPFTAAWSLLCSIHRVLSLSSFWTIFRILLYDDDDDDDDDGGHNACDIDTVTLSIHSYLSRIARIQCAKCYNHGGYVYRQLWLGMAIPCCQHFSACPSLWSFRAQKCVEAFNHLVFLKLRTDDVGLAQNTIKLSEKVLKECGL
jgi:hypothetical protein